MHCVSNSFKLWLTNCHLVMVSTLTDGLLLSRTDLWRRGKSACGPTQIWRDMYRKDTLMFLKNFVPEALRTLLPHFALVIGHDYRGRLEYIFCTSSSKNGSHDTVISYCTRNESNQPCLAMRSPQECIPPAQILAPCGPGHEAFHEWLS